MLDFLWFFISLEWLSYEFEVRAFLAILCIAPLAAMLGVNVLTLRLGFFSDAVAHSGIVGAALGFYLATWREVGDRSTVAVYAQWSMLVCAAIVALGVLFIRRQAALSTDTSIAVVMAGAVSLGLVISHQVNQQQLLTSFLFGDLLLIDPAADLPILVALLIVGLAFSMVTYNRGLLVGVSTPLARAAGVRAALFELVFALLLALTVAAVIRIVGLLVVTALLIVPAATGRNLARSAGGLLRWTLLVSLLSCVLGMALSTYAENWPTGATIVLVACAMFALSVPLGAVHRRQGQ